MTELNGRNFVALVRISDAADRTLANVGETCERILPAPGGTRSGALSRLWLSGKIAPVERASKRSPAAPASVEPAADDETEGVV